MDKVWEFRVLILEGTWITIQLAIGSVLLAILFGLIGAWGKLSKSRTAQRISETYTTIIRGIPDLVLMLLIFFAGQQFLNDLGHWSGWWDYIEINQFAAAVGTIGIIFGAYMTETFRGAILAIPRGQIEAGMAAGMSKSLIFRRIIWPQMVRFALPGFGNNWLVLLKTTALASIIGLQDVFYNAIAIGRKFREPFSFLLVALIIYLILNAISDVGLRRLEKKYNVGVRRG